MSRRPAGETVSALSALSALSAVSGTVDTSGAIAIGVAVGATVILAALVGAAMSLRRSARDLQMLADELADHAARVLNDAEETIARARGELERVDDLVGSAEAITETVGSASRLAHTALATPLIKVMAFGSGTARAGRRLRKVLASTPPRVFDPSLRRSSSPGSRR